MDDTGEETATASHLFGRLSSKEEDPFGEIAANNDASVSESLENIQEMDDKELIAQMDAIELSTNKTLQTSESRTSENLLADDFKKRVKSIWPAPKKFLRLFKNRKEGKPLISSDYAHISQPRLSTFVANPFNRYETDPMDHLALLLRREDYVEVINTTSMIINSIPKDEDPLYFAHFFVLWFYRLQAALRLVENKDETYQKLAEMEAAAFDDSQYANLYRQFFPAKFDDSGSILPFRLRLLSLQITAKVAASTGNVKEINSAISNLFTLLSTVKNVLQADHDFITTVEEQEFFVKIWERRKSAAEVAITAAFVQANNHGAALEFLEKLDKQNCPLHLLEVVKIQIHANMVDDAEETYKSISALEDSVERERSLAKSRLMIQIFKQNWTQAETEANTLVATENDWVSRNNLGVILFQQERISESSAIYNAELTNQLSKVGVIAPSAIFPVQRNLFTLNEMYKQ